MEEQQFRQGEVTSKISGRLTAKATAIINLVLMFSFVRAFIEALPTSFTYNAIIILDTYFSASFT